MWNFRRISKCLFIHSPISRRTPKGVSAEPWLGNMQARSTFYVMRATSARFGLHAGNMKFNTQNK
jgi:hypothetical protein